MSKIEQLSSAADPSPGRDRRRQGTPRAPFQVANRGTIFLDEIGLRQAGTMAFLAEYLAETRDPRTTAGVERGLAALANRSLPISKGRRQSPLESSGLFSLPLGRTKAQRLFGWLGLLYSPAGDGLVVASGPTYDTAHAAATALALLAELRFHRATGSDRFAITRRAWTKGLLVLHVAGSGFRMSPVVLEQSPFYDGESWLALAYYAVVVPDDDAVRALLPSLDRYFMRRYADDVDSGFYQWGTMAAALRLRATADPRFARFIVDQADRILGSGEFERWKRGNSCATVEGLATAVRVLTERGEAEALRRRIEDRIELEMAKNLRLQILADRDRIEIQRAGIAAP
jgi:hypothetical protein